MRSSKADRALFHLAFIAAYFFNWSIAASTSAE
jgi:hypothetical protein